MKLFQVSTFWRDEDEEGAVDGGMQEYSGYIMMDSTFDELQLGTFLRMVRAVWWLEWGGQMGRHNIIIIIVQYPPDGWLGLAMWHVVEKYHQPATDEVISEEFSFLAKEN